MPYDRDLTANPLRRLRGTLLEQHDLTPQLRKHLSQTITELIASCHGFTAQQAAAKGVMAHWQAIRCEEQMLTAKVGSKDYHLSVLSYYKLTALANTCFKLAGVQPKDGRQKAKPPMRAAL